MARYIVKRLLAMIPVLIGVSLLIFFLLYIAPGDPATIALGDSATPEQILEWRTEQGLEDPFFVQYGKYMWGILTRFDFGKSYRSGRPVTRQPALRISDHARACAPGHADLHADRHAAWDPFGKSPQFRG